MRYAWKPSSRNPVKYNSGSGDKARRAKGPSGSCKLVRLYFSVFLHNSIIRFFFFMLTHHVAKTWSFLKGHGRAVHMSPSPAALLWLTDGFHLVNDFKPCSFDTCINPWQQRLKELTCDWLHGASCWRLLMKRSYVSFTWLWVSLCGGTGDSHTVYVQKWVLKFSLGH